jgi:hypothetical protein
MNTIEKPTFITIIAFVDGFIAIGIFEYKQCRFLEPEVGCITKDIPVSAFLHNGIRLGKDADGDKDKCWYK